VTDECVAGATWGRGQRGWKSSALTSVCCSPVVWLPLQLLGDTELVTDESVAGAARGGSAGAGGGAGGRGSDTAGRRRQEVPASTGGTGTGLATYKELCTLATDMGQPDLIYRFMELANYHVSHPMDGTCHCTVQWH